MSNNEPVIKNGSPQLSAILGKCPNCHNAKVFEYKTYDIKNLTKMKDECSNCGIDFQKEPGFYFGAAYVSYGITIALWVSVGVALLCFDLWGLITFSFTKNPWTFIVIGLIAQLVFLPPIYRISRILWFSIFLKNEDDKD